jgi:hypothetical protein
MYLLPRFAVHGLRMAVCLSRTASSLRPTTISTVVENHPTSIPLVGSRRSRTPHLGGGCLCVSSPYIRIYHPASWRCCLSRPCRSSPPTSCPTRARSRGRDRSDLPDGRRGQLVTSIRASWGSDLHRHLEVRAGAIRIYGATQFAWPTHAEHLGTRVTISSQIQLNELVRWGIALTASLGRARPRPMVPFLIAVLDRRVTGSTGKASCYGPEWWGLIA